VHRQDAAFDVFEHPSESVQRAREPVLPYER
jgi:hypothetical protein